MVQNEGGQGRISAWRTLLPHLSQAAWGCGQTGGLETGHLGPDSDSVKHMVTLDKPCPSLGSSSSSSMMRRLSITHSLWLTLVTPWTAAHPTHLSWDFPSKNTGVGGHSLLQGIFPTQGSNLGLLPCREILYHLSHQGSPYDEKVGLNTG